MRTHASFYGETADYLESQLGDDSFARNMAIHIATLASKGVEPEVGELSGAMNAAAPIPAPIRMGAYKLGNTSKAKLLSLFPPLARVVQQAIEESVQDFTVMETIRTAQRQRQLVDQGKSRTMKSKHLKFDDGFAHAVDLGAFNDGVVTWGFDDYFEIVQAMDTAATEQGVADHVRWGAVWDKVLSDFGGVSIADYKTAVEEYKVRHSGSDFLDGPHFEWVV